MAGKKKKEKFEDDGRTVADMNVEGMPWYVPGASGKKPEKPVEKLSRAERRALTGGVLSAAMLVAVIFIVVFFLFILFCSKVWLS